MVTSRLNLGRFIIIDEWWRKGIEYPIINPYIPDGDMEEVDGILEAIRMEMRD